MPRESRHAPPLRPSEPGPLPAPAPVVAMDGGRAGQGRRGRRSPGPRLQLCALAGGGGDGGHQSGASHAAQGPRAGDAHAGPAGTPAPRRGGTIVTGWNAEPQGVNEFLVAATNAGQEMLFQLFPRLLREEPDFERHPPTFSPALARSYEWSADHKTLTFHLREDARWSDGVPVTADDVRWTWQAQVSPEVAWESSYMKDEIADVEAVDAHTVRVRWKRVYAKQLLDVNEGGILPRHEIGRAH